MKRSPHNLSFDRLLTCNQGELVPIGCVPVNPGDTFKHNTTALVRVAPMLSPVMHPVHVRIHHFFCPTRLIWEDFEDFITGGPDGMNASAFPTKTWSGGNLVNAGLGSLNNHLGIPALTSGSTTLSILPIRAVNKIFNDFYRDQDLQTERAISVASGADTTTDVTLPKINWEKDYFTTSRPWAMKGPSVSVPVDLRPPSQSTNANILRDRTTNAPVNVDVYSDGFGKLTDATSSGNYVLDPNGRLAIDPNDLRLSMALMRYQEARAQWGSRYTEYLAYLGVRSSDARLQRAEYLGGGQQTIQFSEVLQTAPNTDTGSSETDGVGNLYGHGIGSVRSNKYLKFFEEHGYVISLLSVKPRTIYANSIPRHYLYSTKEDYFQKELQFIGQQSVYAGEVYAQAASLKGTWSYQDRYDEQRQQLSQVSGEFSPGGSLTDWHMARIFSSEPTLNSSFVEANPTDRIYAEGSATSGGELQIMAHHNLRSRRFLAQNGGRNHVY